MPSARIKKNKRKKSNIESCRGQADAKAKAAVREAYWEAVVDEIGGAIRTTAVRGTSGLLAGAAVKSQMTSGVSVSRGAYPVARPSLSRRERPPMTAWAVRFAWRPVEASLFISCFCCSTP